MRVLRRVVTILLLVLLVSPFRADSQPAQKTSTIGILAMEAWRPIESLRQGLRDLGHIEGQNVRFEHRYAEGRNQRFRALAEDLVATKVDVMVTWGAEELDTALEAVSRERPQAVLVIGDPFLSLQRRRLAQFALKARLPSAYTYREHAEAEGLLAYTPNYPDVFRRAAGYVDKILKGAKPDDLPIRAARQVRSRHQSEDRQGSRSHTASLLVRADQLVE